MPVWSTCINPFSSKYFCVIAMNFVCTLVFINMNANNQHLINNIWNIHLIKVIIRNNFLLPYYCLFIHKEKTYGIGNMSCRNYKTGKVTLYLGIQCYKLWSFIILFLCLHILLNFLQKGNWHFWQPALEFCQRDDKLKFWEFMCSGMFSLLCLVWNRMICWFLSEHVFQAEYKQAILLTRKREG